MTVSHGLLEKLNSAQRSAVTTLKGPLLVLAGPGSGKTRVLTNRIAYMISAAGIAPRQIMAVTFTNKAADEMRERVEQYVDHLARDVRLGTFHATCAWLLRREVEATPYRANFQIYDTGDQQALMKNIIHEMNKDPKQHQPNKILATVSQAKNNLVLPEDYPATNYREQIVQEAYRRYMQKLQRNNALDFDDLLVQAVLLLQDNPEVREKYQNRFQYLMVDEFQDTNMAQYEFVRLLAGDQRNIFVVGDPDQSIYAFRGADYRNVARFRHDYPDYTLITLDENYRSHQLILDAAMAVIRKDPSHIQRDLFSQRRSGPQIEVHELRHEREEGHFVVDKIRRLQQEEGYRPGDFAIMYRVNAQSRTLEEAFVSAKIPYQIVGGVRFYERMEIKDLLAYLRLITNPEDTLSLGRIINVPTRGIGKKTVETFSQWAQNHPAGQWGALQDVYSGSQRILAPRAASALQDFVALLNKWIARRDDPKTTPLELLDMVLADTQYLEYLEGRPDDRGENRADNVAELRRNLAEFEGFTLSEMLEEIALVADVDRLDTKGNIPVMMTLHAAKGLEFPVVFLVGLEEGLLPHERSMESSDQMGEERRLLYVGITRAKDRLYLCHSNVRSGFYGTDYRDPSRFLEDLPRETTLRQTPYQPLQPVVPHARVRFTPLGAPAPAKTPPPARLPSFNAGATVSHNIFGKGIVISAKVESGFEQVMVKFEKYGTKVLDASFLHPLNPLG